MEKSPVEKILVVDDDCFICGIYKKVFEKEGVEIEVLHSGKEMLDKLREVKEGYEVILLDIFMPEMDGFEALEVAHKEGLTKNSLVIILSNQADQVAQKKAKELGAKRFIVKSSFLPEDIAKEVLKTCREHLPSFK